MGLSYAPVQQAKLTAWSIRTLYTSLKIQSALLLELTNNNVWSNSLSAGAGGSPKILTNPEPFARTSKTVAMDVPLLPD